MTGRRPLVWLYASAAVMVGCWVLPSFVIRPGVDVNTFRPEKGMTMDEVRSRYGPPSEAHPGADGVTEWDYYTDYPRLGLGWIAVEFDATGRVTGSWTQ